MKNTLFIVLLLFISILLLSQDNGSKELFLVTKGARFNGPDVVRLQKFLVYKGIYIGKDGIDGWFGTDTDTALRQYQKAAGLKVTGRIRVSDIPETLNWKPVLKKWKEAGKPEKTSEPPREIKEGILKTYYGTKQIMFTDYDIRYTNFILNPDGRFLYYEGYSVDYDDPRDGHTHFVYDLLTGDEFVFSSLSALFDVNSKEYETRYDTCKSSSITNVYWTFDGDLYFEAQALFDDHPEQRRAFILEVQ